MAFQYLRNCVIHAAGYDLTGAANSVSVGWSADDLDTTTFASDGKKERIAGQASGMVTVAGYWDAGAAGATPDYFFVDDAIAATAGVSDTPVTAAVTNSDGAVCYFLKAVHTNYSLLGDSGTVAPFTFTAAGSGDVYRGTVLHPGRTTRTTSGTGTGRLIGAASATQRVYAVLHVTAVSGTTPELTVTVQSDDNAGFTSATSAVSFTAASTAGSEWQELAGPRTDTYYRVTYTISGTNPSFQFLVGLAII